MSKIKKQKWVIKRGILILLIIIIIGFILLLLKNPREWIYGSPRPISLIGNITAESKNCPGDPIYLTGIPQEYVVHDQSSYAIYSTSIEKLNPLYNTLDTKGKKYKIEGVTDNNMRSLCINGKQTPFHVIKVTKITPLD